MRRGDLAELESGALARMQGALTGVMQDLFQDEVGKLSGLVKETQQLADRRASANEARINEVDEEVQQLKSGQCQMQEEINHLKGCMSFVSKSKLEPYEFGPRVWDRPPDPTVLYAGAQALVTKQSIEELLFCGPQEARHPHGARQGWWQPRLLGQAIPDLLRRRDASFGCAADLQVPGVLAR